MVQDERDAAAARSAREAAEAEDRQRLKHSASIGCVHETHEADMEVMRRKLSDAQEDAAELRRTVAKLKADSDAMTVRCCPRARGHMQPRKCCKCAPTNIVGHSNLLPGIPHEDYTP